MTAPVEDANDPANARPDSAGPPAMPRWVKTALIVVGALLLLFLILKLTGAGGEHGPGRHNAGAESQDRAGARVVVVSG